MAQYKLNVKMPCPQEGEQAKTVEFFVTSAFDLDGIETPEGMPTLAMIAFEKVAQFDMLPRTRDYGHYRSRMPCAASSFRDELCVSDKEMPDTQRFGVLYQPVDDIPKDAWRVAYADRMMEFISGRCDYLSTFESMRKKDKLAFWGELRLTGVDLMKNPEEMADAAPEATDSGIARNVCRRILQYELACRVPASDMRHMERQLLAAQGNASLLQMCYGANSLFVPTPAKGAQLNASASE